MCSINTLQLILLCISILIRYYTVALQYSRLNKRPACKAAPNNHNHQHFPPISSNVNNNASTMMTGHNDHDISKLQLLTRNHHLAAPYYCQDCRVNLERKLMFPQPPVAPKVIIVSVNNLPSHRQSCMRSANAPRQLVHPLTA